MTIRALFWWDRLRASFWFLPALLAFCSVACFLLTLEIDRRLGSSWDSTWWLYGGNHEGARAVLSVVASSMITVAGVVFSIMMVVLSLAAQQYGPRLLRNFMRDRATQLVLGCFVATFLYCLLVLRTIRGGEEQFVPQISVTVGIALSILSLSVLIFFIHHVSVSIHIGNIISRVQDELLAAIDEVFPEMVGEGEEDGHETNSSETEIRSTQRDSAPVISESSGYLEAIEDGKLLAAARRCNLLVQLDVRPGDYILKQQAVMRASPREKVDDGAIEELRDSLLLGSQRTPVQDVLFALQRQADIAVRALSPGINDPLTAIDSLEHIREALCRLAERRIPSPYRYDEDGQLRVIAPPISFEEMVESSLGLVRQYAGGSPVVLAKILEIIEQLIRHARRGDDVAVLQKQLRAIAATPLDHLSEIDRAQLRALQHNVSETLNPVANVETTC